jgi:hypothetical protein
MTYKYVAKKCIKVWRNFVHSYMNYWSDLVSYMMNEGNGFSVLLEWTASTS